MESERLCCNHTRQFLCLHWRLKFDRYDERHCAELASSGLDTQTIVLDVPTQEQVANKRLIIQNNAVPAWKQSCRRPPKVTNDWSEHAIVLLRLPTNQRMKRPSARDIALRANGVNLLRRPGGGSGSGSAAARVTTRTTACATATCKTEFGTETEMTDATVDQQEESRRRREHPEAPQPEDSSTSSSSSSESSTDTERAWWVCVRFSVTIPRQLNEKG